MQIKCLKHFYLAYKHIFLITNPFIRMTTDCDGCQVDIFLIEQYFSISHYECDLPEKNYFNIDSFFFMKNRYLHLHLHVTGEM